MIEIEAYRIAQEIREVAPQEMHVEAIVQHPKTRMFRLRCWYKGPTFKRDWQLFLHGTQIWITRPYEWAKLRRLLNKKSS